MAPQEVVKHTIGQLAQRLRRAEVSPVEVLDAYQSLQEDERRVVYAVVDELQGQRGRRLLAAGQEDPANIHQAKRG